MPLRDLEIRALKPQDKIYKRADERGLYIEVHPGGAKLWRLKYRHLGKDKRIAFGSYPQVSLTTPHSWRATKSQRRHGRSLDMPPARVVSALAASANDRRTFA